MISVFIVLILFIIFNLSSATVIVTDYKKIEGYPDCVSEGFTQAGDWVKKASFTYTIPSSDSIAPYIHIGNPYYAQVHMKCDLAQTGAGSHSVTIDFHTMKNSIGISNCQLNEGQDHYKDLKDQDQNDLRYYYLGATLYFFNSDTTLNLQVVRHFRLPTPAHVFYLDTLADDHVEFIQGLGSLSPTEELDYISKLHFIIKKCVDDISIDHIQWTGPYSGHRVKFSIDPSKYKGKSGQAINVGHVNFLDINASDVDSYEIRPRHGGEIFQVPAGNKFIMTNLDIGIMFKFDGVNESTIFHPILRQYHYRFLQYEVSYSRENESTTMYKEDPNFGHLLGDNFYHHWVPEGVEQSVIDQVPQKLVSSVEFVIKNLVSRTGLRTAIKLSQAYVSQTTICELEPRFSEYGYQLLKLNVLNLEETDGIVSCQTRASHANDWLDTFKGPIAQVHTIGLSWIAEQRYDPSELFNSNQMANTNGSGGIGNKGYLPNTQRLVQTIGDVEYIGGNTYKRTVFAYEDVDLVGIHLVKQHTPGSFVAQGVGDTLTKGLNTFTFNLQYNRENDYPLKCTGAYLGCDGTTPKSILPDQSPNYYSVLYYKRRWGNADETSNSYYLDKEYTVGLKPTDSLISGVKRIQRSKKKIKNKNLKVKTKTFRSKANKKLTVKKRARWNDNLKAKFLDAVSKAIAKGTKFEDAIAKADKKIKRITQRRRANRNLLQDLVEDVEYSIDFNLTDEIDADDFTMLVEEDHSADFITEYNDALTADDGVEPLTEADDVFESGEYDVYEPAEGEISNNIITSSESYTVPTGIYQLSVKAQSGSGVALSFDLRVQPADTIDAVISGDAVLISHNGEDIAHVDSDRSYSGHLLNIGSLVLGQQGVEIEWYDACPAGYTDLHSDFDPILLPESSLYLTNNVPSLQIDVQLPEYYYDIDVSYGSDCTAAPSLNSEAAGCNTIHKTSINYVNDCSFNSVEDGDNIKYQGVLTISAKLDLDIDGYQITRNVSGPLSWQVTLARQVSVDADIEVKEDSVCTTSADCGEQGCCVGGACDCTCDTSTRVGYSGIYCENDITAPVCDSGCEIHTFDSPHGGSINAFDRDLYDLPVFSDNSGETVIISDIQIDGQSVDDENYDFPIGSTTVTYFVTDSSGNNAIFQYTINIEDKSAPVVDCHDCQDDSTTDLSVCRGTAIGWEKVTLSEGDFLTLISDPSIAARGAVNPSLLPGQDLSSTDTYSGQLEASSGYLSCDCELESESPSYSSSIITNSWESWGVPNAYDHHDGSINVGPEVDPAADGSYDVEYTASDPSGNEGSCTKREIIYDVTDPTCTDFYAAPDIDDADKNFSLPVAYLEADHAPVFGISGEGSKQLTPPRDNNVAYRVGYAYNLTVTSTYNLVDGAGNTGSCDWEVFVDNPNPCVYPTCDDAPPSVDNCPDAQQFECATPRSWSPPDFTDDKFIKTIHVDFDGEQVEEYNNDETSEAYNLDLDLGNTAVKYEGFDMHDESAECNFVVTIVDTTDPVFTHCPQGETLQSTGTSTSYTYHVAATDSCEDPIYGTVGYPANADNYADHTLDLPLGTTDFHYTAEDSTGNKVDCQWSVTVEDNGPPEVTCPSDHTERAAQGTTTVAVNYEVTGTDSAGDVTISYSHNPGHSFPVGTTTVTGTATDGSGNTATCTFDVIILAGYPYAEFEAALVGALVNEDGSGNFGADLTIMSFTNIYHRVDSVISADNLSVSNSANNCDENAAVCQQSWTLRVEFSDCQVSGETYDFNADIDCLPADCAEDTSPILKSFTVELSAANYCWQDLESVEVTGELKTLLKVDHDVYKLAYTNDPSTASFSPATVFSNGDEISGIVSVSSDQVVLTNVDLTSASRQHYSDSARQVTAGSALDVLQNEYNEDTWASFTYTESDVPLESTRYTTYTATVELSYDFGSNSRRMLLDIDTQRQLLQSDSDAIAKTFTAETVSFATQEVTEQVESNVDDAKVVLKLSSCDNTESLEDAFTTVIANELRIDTTRVNVLIDNNTCFMQVTVTQSDCDSVSIIDILAQLEQSIADPFNAIHSSVYYNQDIPMDITFDNNVFFVSQQPANVINSQAIAAANSSSDANNDSNDWLVYAVAGVAAGAMISVAINKRKN